MDNLARRDAGSPTVEAVDAMAAMRMSDPDWTEKLTNLLQSVYEQGRADERKLVELGHYDDVEESRLSLVRDAPLPDREELEAVLRSVVGSRTETFTISVDKLAAVCRRAGLFGSLPDLEHSGLTELWRDEMRSAFCGPGWTANRRAWRVTCYNNGAFWIRLAARR